MSDWRQPLSNHRDRPIAAAINQADPAAGGLVTPGNDWGDTQLAQASFASCADLIPAKGREESHFLPRQPGQLNSHDSSGSSWFFEGAMGTADLPRRREFIDGKKSNPLEVPDNSKREISGK
jgi:hypothetical protein